MQAVGAPLSVGTMPVFVLFLPGPFVNISMYLNANCTAVTHINIELDTNIGYAEYMIKFEN